jgi:hypothetical protein
MMCTAIRNPRSQIRVSYASGKNNTSREPVKDAGSGDDCNWHAGCKKSGRRLSDGQGKMCTSGEG